MSENKKELTDEEKAFIKLLKYAGIGFLIFSILSAVGTLAASYLRVRMIKNEFESLSTKMHSTLQSNSQRQITRPPITANQPIVVQQPIKQQPRSIQNQGSIQSKTYKNGSLIKETESTEGCIYNGEKKVCLKR